MVGGEDPLAGCKTLDTAEGERGSRERRQRERERDGAWAAGANHSQPIRPHVLSPAAAAVAVVAQ